MNQKQIDVAEKFHGKNPSQNENINKFVENNSKDLNIQKEYLMELALAITEIVTNRDFSKYEEWKQKMETIKKNNKSNDKSI